MGELVFQHTACVRCVISVERSQGRGITSHVRYKRIVEVVWGQKAGSNDRMSTAQFCDPTTNCSTFELSTFSRWITSSPLGIFHMIVVPSR